MGLDGQAGAHEHDAQQNGEGHVAQARQGGHAQGLARRPVLSAPDQYERQPVGWQRRVQEGDGETGGGDRGEKRHVHAELYSVL